MATEFGRQRKAKSELQWSGSRWEKFSNHTTCDRVPESIPFFLASKSINVIDLVVGDKQNYLKSLYKKEQEPLAGNRPNLAKRNNNRDHPPCDSTLGNETRNESYTEIPLTYHDKTCTKQADPVNLVWESASVSWVLQKFKQQGWEERGSKKNYLQIHGVCTPQFTSITKPCDDLCNPESNEQRYHVRLWVWGSVIVGSAHVDKRLWPRIFPIRRHKAVAYELAKKRVAKDFKEDGCWRVTESACIMSILPKMDGSIS